MTLQQLAAFDSAFDNCKANHPTHSWYHSIAEGLKAVAGESNLKLTDEELAAVHHMKQIHNIANIGEFYNRDEEIAEAYKNAGMDEDHALMLIRKYGAD